MNQAPNTQNTQNTQNTESPTVMGNADTITIKTKVGAQDYALRVAKSSEPEVNAAVALVTQRFNAIQASGKIKDPERIAVMVALNLAVEMNKANQAPVTGFDFPNTDIATLRQHIGHLLKT